MNKHLLVFLLTSLWGLGNSSTGQDAPSEPLELRNTRAWYRQQVKAGMEPFKLQYSTALETMKRTLGGKGDLAGALAVQKEIDSFENPSPTEPNAANEPAELRNARAWYRQQSKTVTDPIKLLYSTALETMKRTFGGKGDLTGALAVQKEIDSLEIVPSPPTGPQKGAQLIIWNQNNGGKGDRGSKKVDVILFAGGREVWRKNAVRLKWDPTREMKEEIAVPALAVVEKIRIEVTELVNDRGGVAEIEYIKAGKNIALNCPVAVSGVWESNQKHIGATLTDGLPATYWLLPDKLKGWAEISLQENR